MKSPRSSVLGPRKRRRILRGPRTEDRGLVHGINPAPSDLAIGWRTFVELVAAGDGGEGGGDGVDDHLDVERLADRPGDEIGAEVARLGAGSEDEDQRAIFPPPFRECVQHFIAVQLRHHQVEQDDRIAAALAERQRLGAISGAVDGESAPPQDRAKQRADGVVVVDHEHTFLDCHSFSALSEAMITPAGAHESVQSIQARVSRRSRFSGCSARLGWVAARHFTISELKAGRSSGLRLLTQLPSRTHCSSFQFAPALRMSSSSVGHVVIVCPFTSPELMRIQPPWQMTKIGFPARSISCRNCCPFFSTRIASPLMTPPGRSTASKSLASAFESESSTSSLSALSWCLNPWICPSFGETSTHFAPAFSSASRGLVSSICSTPSVARIATRLPLRS